MQPGHVWVDGEVHPAEGTHLSVFDRGFQLGDAVFETLRARAGRVTELDEHVARLGRSADGLGIELPADIADRLARDPGPAGRRGARRARWRCLDPDHGVPRCLPRRGLLPPEVHTTPTIAIQAWPVARRRRAISNRDPPRLVIGPPRSAEPTRHAQDDVACRLRLRPTRGAARRRGRRAVPDDRRPLSEATSANIFLVRHAQNGEAELARRHSTARSCPAPRDRGCSAGPSASASGRRGVADAARPGRRRRGVRVVERGRDPAGDAVRRSRHRHGTARTVGSPRPRGPRGVHPRRGAGMTRDELIARTRQLIDEGDRLAAEPPSAPSRSGSSCPTTCCRRRGGAWTATTSRGCSSGSRKARSVGAR